MTEQDFLDLEHAVKKIYQRFESIPTNGVEDYTRLLMYGALNEAERDAVVDYIKERRRRGA